MLLGGLKHWLEDNPEIVRMVNTLPEIHREDICKE
jgi:hypothetical protein